MSRRTNIDPNATEKFCGTCGNWKPKTDFGRWSRGRDSLQTRCKACISVYCHDNLDRIKADSAKRRAAKKAAKKLAKLQAEISRLTDTELASFAAARLRKKELEKAVSIQKIIVKLLEDMEMTFNG
jgi:hypothetical protein